MGLTTFNILWRAPRGGGPGGAHLSVARRLRRGGQRLEAAARASAAAAPALTLVVPTLYRRTALADAILAKLPSTSRRELSRDAAGVNVKIDEAQSHGQTIWEYAPRSRRAERSPQIAERSRASAGAQPAPAGSRALRRAAATSALERLDFFSSSSSR